MPERDGLDLAADIRADAHLRGVSLMLLTSRGERLTTAQMASYGLAACELKPLHPDKLRIAIGRTLSAAAYSAPRPTVAPRPLAARLPAADISILIAEDNPVNQKVTTLLLRSLGYAADVAANGIEVLAALRRHRYALVLMDAQMPEMDGLEATRRIRQDEEAAAAGPGRRIKIVAMTANAMAGDREACLAAGMDDYLAKPVKPEDLRAMLQRYLKPAAPVPAAKPVEYAAAV
jgi:CheY-like chemotaxis protein